MVAHVAEPPAEDPGTWCQSKWLMLDRCFFCHGWKLKEAGTPFTHEKQPCQMIRCAMELCLPCGWKSRECGP